MSKPLFQFEIPSPEDFRRYQNIGAQIMEVFERNQVDEQTALRVLEMTTAITLDRVGNISGFNPLNFVEPFGVNVKGYILQLQLKQQ